MTHYVTGIVAVGLLPVLPPLWGLLLAGLILLWLWRYQRCPRGLGYLFAGVLVASLWGWQQLSHRPVTLDSSRIWTLRGSVVSLPEQQPGRVRFQLQLSADSVPPELHNLRRLRLSWYRSDITLKPGMQVQLTAKLYRPRSMANPGGFDYPRWLLSRSIDATGYVRQLKLLQHSGCCAVEQARGFILDQLSQRIASPLAQATLAALLLGVKTQLSDPQWDILRKTGTVHLVVISGLHIGFAALAGSWLGALFYRLFTGYGQDYRLARVIGALLVATTYLLLSGSGLPGQRALVMIAAFLLGWLWMRGVSGWQRWWLALAAVLTLSPLAFYEAGFWLSFAAVGVLIGLGAIRHQRGLLWRTQIALMLGLFPLLAYWFEGGSLLAPLINLVAIPATAMLLLLSVLVLGVSFVSGWHGLVPLLSATIEGGWWLLEQAAAQSFSWLTLPPLPGWALLLAGAGSLLMLLPRQVPGRRLALLCWLPMLVGVIPLQPKPPFEAWLFDVGQGVSVLVRAGDRAMLYDTGAAWRSGGSAFQRAVYPALRKLGVGKLDLLVLSHRDNDHAGGRHHLMQALTVGQRVSGSARLTAEEGYTACRAGQQWRWGDVRLRMLAGSQGRKENARSCVMQVEYDGCRLLLTGDIGFEQEARLPLQPVSWLVASHHGSRFGTGNALLQRSQPGLLLFSAGANNPFGHPHRDVIERARLHGVRMVATPQQGAIRLWMDAEGRCRHQGWRGQQRRYWQIPSTEEYGRVAV